MQIPTPPFPRVALIGTGVMGRGIAQLLAQAGCEVHLYDSREGAAVAARAYVAEQLERLAAKGKVDPAAAAAAVARLHLAERLADLAGCHLAVEAIVEDLAAKRTLFAALEDVLAEAAVLATNTSSLSVTEIAAGCRRPERVAGLHFFNPVPLMRVVEVIGGARTAPAVVERLADLVAATGHRPVRAADTPGFVVNHAGRAYVTEALRIAGEGIAGFAAIDDVLREAAGFRLGPFELLDLTALDVSHPVMESIYGQYYQEPRYRPSPIARQRMIAGLLGRKTGRGFYAYDGEGRRIAEGAVGEADETTVAQVPREAPPVWVGGGEAGDVAALRDLAQAAGATVEAGAAPTAGALILVCPLGDDATTVACDLGLDPERTLAVDPLYGFARRRTLMATPVTAAPWKAAARRLLTRDGVPATVIRDSPGFIAQRTLAMIVNLGADLAQQRICTPDDLDAAVRLGLAYPEGPLALGDTLGPARLLAILERLHAFYGDPRYRPSPWLKRRARLEVSLRVGEG